MSLFALFGGMGEFDEWAEPVHRRLVDSGTGDGSVAILPMGYRDDAFIADREITLYERLGAPAAVVPVRSRADALVRTNADAVGQRSAIFLHGGMMHWLVQTLADSPVWEAIVVAVERGASLAGTSGGMCCLGKEVVAPGNPNVEWVPGLGLFDAIFGPHWDNTDFGFIREPTENLPSDELIVAVDEHAVMVGDGTRWSVGGKGAVHVIKHGRDDLYRDGESFDLALR